MRNVNPRRLEEVEEEEEIDENRNPSTQPEIQTRKLTDYRIILAPQPIPLPTRRQIRDALRCRKSGMVPGAIRKYLLQKKKAEDEEEVPMEEEELEIQEGEEIEVEEQLVSPQEVQLGEEDGERESPLQQNNNDDDEVQFLEEVTPSTPRSNISRTPSNPSSRRGRFSHSNSVSGSASDTDSSSLNNNEKKRAFSEAFSPDTTTPEEGIVPVPAPPPALDPSLTENHHANPNPAKKQKTGDNEEDSQNKPSTSKGSGNRRKKSPPTTRVAPFRKTKAVSQSTSGSSYSSSASSSPRSVIKVLTETDLESQYSQESDDPQLDQFVRRNEWKKVISHFRSSLLFDKKIPKPCHLADFIKKAILGFGTRVPKDVPEQALEFFTVLKAKYPIGGPESREYYRATFTQISDDTMPQFLFSLLDVLRADAEARVPCRHLPFFKQLTKMVVQQYKSYMSSGVKVRQPFFVQFLEDNEKVLSYNFYCKKLVEYTFKMKDAADELRTVMRWVGLLAHHYKTHSNLEAEFDRLVEDIVERLTKPNFGPICPMVQSIAESSLGSAVAIRILIKKITFESASRLGEKAEEKDIAIYLRSIAKTDMISGLKSILVERRHSTDFPPLVSSLVAANGKKMKKPTVNRKGEHELHKMCKKLAPDAKDDSGLRLDDLLKRKHYDSVNPVDNFGNTPLHDAIANGRFDAVTKFWEYCSNPSLPEALRVNLMAQNQAGDTPFHLAAVSAESDNMCRVLSMMADKLQVKEEALKILNMQGKMCYELAFNADARSVLKPQKISEWIFELGDVKVPPQYRHELQSLEIRKLVLLWSEFYKQLKENSRFN